MTDKETKALQPKAKTEVTQPAESTRPGLVFTPDVDIFETDQEIMLLADMPGVKSQALNIDLHENILTLDGEVEPPESADERDLLREYRTGKFHRQFTLSQAIDQEKIEASMKDGVLRLRLPKVKAARPHKITVKAK